MRERDAAHAKAGFERRAARCQHARQHLLSDAPERAGQDPENFRPIHVGQVAGSRYYLVGGVTELNYNIASNGVNVQAGDVSTTGLRGLGQASRYVMNVAVDLRLVDTRSQEVVNSVSFQCSPKS